MVQNGNTYYFPAIKELIVNMAAIPAYAFQSIVTPHAWKINGVVSIGAHAFEGAQSTGRVVSENDIRPSEISFDTSGLTTIGDYAFASSVIYTTDLSTVVNFGVGIFAGKSMYGLTLVTIPSAGLASLFNVDSQAEDIYAVVVGDDTYYVPNNFASITFVGTTIPANAFDGFTTLRCFNEWRNGFCVIPNTVASIGAYAFRGTDINTLFIDGDATTVASNAFDGVGIGDLTYSGVLTSSTFTTLFGTEKSSLSRITMKTATTIPGFAFAGMNLNDLIFEQTVTSVDGNAFENAYIANRYITYDSGN